MIKGKNKHECLLSREGEEKEDIPPPNSACVNWRDDYSVDKASFIPAEDP